jgi:hypothetical protein
MWTEWRKFPDPTKGEKFVAPSGPGCYELRRGDTPVLVGESVKVSDRIRSLLPRECGGVGHRSNVNKQEYVFIYLEEIEYRTIPAATKEEARAVERQLLNSKKYLFNT